MGLSRIEPLRWDRPCKRFPTSPNPFREHPAICSFCPSSPYFTQNTAQISTAKPNPRQMSQVVHNSSIAYGDNNRNSGNTTNSYNEFNQCNISIPDEKRQILEWISPFATREGTRLFAIHGWRRWETGYFVTEAFLHGAHQRTGRRSLSYSAMDIRELARRI